MDRTITVGDVTLTISAAQRSGLDGAWTAEARRAPSGMRIGPPATAASADEACGRLVRWLEWQCDHQAALAALQAAEQTYHRAVAGSGFASGLTGPTDEQRDTLQQIEVVRARLDEVRLAQPRL